MSAFVKQGPHKIFSGPSVDRGDPGFPEAKKVEELPCTEEGCAGTMRQHGPIQVCRKCGVQHTPRADRVRGR